MKKSDQPSATELIHQAVIDIKTNPEQTEEILRKLITALNK